MIESSDVTFALFVTHEKPQVSPRPAARFIKKGRVPCPLDVATTNPCPAWKSRRTDDRLPMSLYLLYFFAMPMPWNRESPWPKPSSIAHLRRPLMDAAGPDRDSDLLATVTNMQQIFRRFRPGRGRNDPPWKRPSAGWRGRITGMLPKSWAKAGAFSLLTLKSKLAHN
jgi:hypothetical protein